MTRVKLQKKKKHLVGGAVDEGNPVERDHSEQQPRVCVLQDLVPVAHPPGQPLLLPTLPISCHALYPYVMWLVLPRVGPAFAGLFE